LVGGEDKIKRTKGTYGNCGCGKLHDVSRSVAEPPCKQERKRRSRKGVRSESEMKKHGRDSGLNLGRRQTKETWFE